MDPLFCRERDRLLTEWSAAMGVYSAAVTELHASMGRVPRSRYESLKEAADTAQRAGDQTRAAYDAHRQEHGC